MLYFFLVAVSDCRGLSFYGDRSIEKLLKMGNGQLNGARRELIEKDLIAYCAPVYQVLSVEKKPLDKV